MITAVPGRDQSVMTAAVELIEIDNGPGGHGAFGMCKVIGSFRESVLPVAKSRPWIASPQIRLDCRLTVTGIEAGQLFEQRAAPNQKPPRDREAEWCLRLS